MSKYNFNFMKDNDTVAHNLLILAMTEYMKDKEDIVSTFNYEEQQGTGDMEIYLLVNGVQIPFLPCIKRMDAHFKDKVTRTAEEFVDESVRHKMEPLEEAIDDLKERVQSTLIDGLNKIPQP